MAPALGARTTFPALIRFFITNKYLKVKLHQGNPTALIHHIVCWYQYLQEVCQAHVFPKDLSKYRFKNYPQIFSAAMQLRERVCKGLPYPSSALMNHNSFIWQHNLGKKAMTLALLCSALPQPFQKWWFLPEAAAELSVFHSLHLYATVMRSFREGLRCSPDSMGGLWITSQIIWWTSGVKPARSRLTG